MDDEHEQLEAELKQLRPVAPPASLLACVERDLTPGSAGASPASGTNAGRKSARPNLAPIHWFWAAALPAAAVVAVVFALSSLRPKAVSPAQAAGPAATETLAPLKPITAENVLVSSRDEGLVTLDDGTPARRERLQFVDTITWKNPRTNASLTWRVPREEVRVVPVSFQ